MFIGTIPITVLLAGMPVIRKKLAIVYVLHEESSSQQKE